MTRGNAGSSEEIEVPGNGSHEIRVWLEAARLALKSRNTM